MKKMRSHILKCWIILLVCTGFVSTMIEPADAAPSNKAFADWLQSLARKTHSADLRQKLAPLENSKADINQIIEKASEIIRRNDRDFNLPAGAAKADIQQILLLEWNQYRTGNEAMAAIPSVETSKPLITPQPRKFSPRFASYLKSANTSIPFYVCPEVSQKFRPFYAPSVAPLISGIAIGAP